MDLQHCKFDKGEDQIGILWLDQKDSNVNVLNIEMVEELHLAIGEMEKDTTLRGLIITSAKEGQFIAGASIDEIQGLTDALEAAEKAQIGQSLMAKIADLSIPTVAAINGPCLGGGFELALSCKTLISADDSGVRLALPEVKLGIIPGFGGTQRLPKKIGLLPAMDLILSGRSLKAAAALRVGILSDVVPKEILIEVAKMWIDGKARPKRKKKPKGSFHYLSKLKPIRKLFYKKARQKVIASAGTVYPAPLKAIDVLEETYSQRHVDGYDVEAQAVGELIASPVCKSLIHLFQMTEEVRKTQHPAPPLVVQKIGVLGAGVMGGGIAYLATKQGLWVRLKDLSKAAISKSMEEIRSLSAKDLRRRRINKRQLRDRLQRVMPTTTSTGFTQAQVVIEAVIEKMEVKKALFFELEKQLPQDTILASNTSALSITEMAKGLEVPQRVIGMHFFNPVSKMPLVEIIRGDKTSDMAVATISELALKLGKTPIVVADRPGFLVNRILGLYLNEACCLAEESIPIEDIESAMKSFGMPMGPFELMDTIGLDVAEKVGMYLANALPHFPESSLLISSIHTDERLGQKSGKGFYIHNKKGKTLDKKVIRQVLSKLKRETDWAMEGGQYESLVDRLILLMVNEATRCLEEKVVEHERDIDLGMVLGTGFAPFRGGLMRYARTRGLPEVYHRLQELAKRHGDIFAPTEHLRTLAENLVPGTSFPASL